MNILFAASEMVPFCKTGGLADVIGALPPVLVRMGHEVSVMLPGYSIIDRKRFGFNKMRLKLQIPVGSDMKPLHISSVYWKGVTVYLLENGEYFDRGHLYGNTDGDYEDNGSRFIFFSRAVLEMAKRLENMPDVVHTHDWQAGLVTAYLATLYKNDRWFAGSAALFTIHNLGYQGVFPEENFTLTGLPREEFSWTKLEYWGDVSFIKGGIVYGDAVSTVSKKYSGEILGDDLGFGLQGVFGERRDDLYGIVNGIDHNEWNPSSDTSIPAQYSINDMPGKKRCRDALLETCGLKADKFTPVFGMVTRLDDQKGIDILESSVSRLAAMNLRLVILGTGTQEHHKTMKRLMLRYPKCINVMLRFDSD
ncbi:MAG: glycogen synthase, partial [Candidatus Latescibacteria bacterium]|nr:glycogen synthase [Candidatus Latescibacterota bacterium]